MNGGHRRNGLRDRHYFDASHGAYLYSGTSRKASQKYAKYWKGLTFTLGLSLNQDYPSTDFIGLKYSFYAFSSILYHSLIFR